MGDFVFQDTYHLPKASDSLKSLQVLHVWKRSHWQDTLSSSSSLGSWKLQDGNRLKVPSLDFSASKLFPVGWVGDLTEEEKVDLRAKELNQGRAAMMGILALMVHEKLDGNPYIFFDPSNGFAPTF